MKVTLQIAESEHSKASSSPAAVTILRSIYVELDADQEHFCLLAVDSKNHVRGYKVLFSGGATNSIIDPKIVFRAALLFGAVKIIIAHNHPSRDPEPSPEDHRITEEIARAAWFMHVPLIDHIILGEPEYFSFSDRGLLKGDGWDRNRTCYHRFGEEILADIKRFLPLVDPATEKRVRRLLRDRGASAADWKRLKLSKSEEMQIKKEALLAEFIKKLREAEDVQALEVRVLDFGERGAV